MATKIRGSGIPGMPWRAMQYANVGTGGKTFVVDGFHHVIAIAFAESGMDGALTALTVTINVENTIVVSACPIVLLGALGSQSNPQAPGNGGTVTFIPPAPIRFNASCPIIITPSGAVEVLLFGREVVEGD